MFAILLLLSAGATLGFMSVAAGFLIIVASVTFVIKGKAVLSDSGAPNALEWGKMKANLTSAVFLFALGAAMVVLPFLRVQQMEAEQGAMKIMSPASANLVGTINGTDGKNLRVLVVVKPDYDTNYGSQFNWQVPLVAQRASYSILYVDGGSIVGEQSFSVKESAPGSPMQTIPLTPFGVQPGGHVGPQASKATKEVSDAELKSMGLIN